MNLAVACSLSWLLLMLLCCATLKNRRTWFRIPLNVHPLHWSLSRFFLVLSSYVGVSSNAYASPVSMVWLVWRSGNGVGHVNRVKLRRARLILGLVTTFDACAAPYLSRPTQPDHPPWEGTMSTGDGFGHRWRRNCEFCVVVNPVTKTARILCCIA